jgi:hypothetical protein
MSRLGFGDALLIGLVSLSLGLAWQRSSVVAPTIARGASSVPNTSRIWADAPRGSAFVRSPFRLVSDAVAPHTTVEPVPIVEVAPAVPIPAMRVSAIAGGPPWSAVVAGFTNAPADRVMRAGDAFDGVTVRAVTATHVEFAARDSSWRVAVPERRP